MKSLYQASNSLEAHMVAGVLRQQGLHAHIAGEYLQGGVGELPAGGTVRLLIDDADFDAARRAIADWEGTQVDVTAPAALAAPPGKARFAWGTFLLGLSLGFVLASLA